MTGKQKTAPVGYGQATPYLCVKGAAAALEFYKKAFGAVETLRLDQPDGRIGHAEIKIGEAPIFLADEFPEIGVLSPDTLGGTPVSIHLYVDDIDALAADAVREGAKVLTPVEDKFYGDRAGKFQDPFGHVWMMATHKEDVSTEEMQERNKALYGESQ